MRVAASVCLAAVLLAGAGCKKKPAPAAPVTPPTEAGPVGGQAGTNYIPGGGAIQNVRQAAKRTILLNDLRTLGQFIELAYNDTNRMPDLDSIRQTLKTQAPNILAAVDDGSLILCWTANHEGLWAYEAGSDTSGGLALVSGTPNRYSAEEIKRLLGR